MSTLNTSHDAAVYIIWANYSAMSSKASKSSLILFMQVFKLVLTNYTRMLKSGLGLEVSGGVTFVLRSRCRV